jgi:hypothetical protein
MLDKSWVYMAFTFLAVSTALIIIPKQLYKRFFLYGAIFGGMGDAVVVTILSKFFHLIQYKGMGYFNVFGLFSIWTPITWTFAFMVFFYLLPIRKLFLIPYLLILTFFNYSVGLVLQSMGLFEYIGIEKYLSPFIFLAWYSIAAWVYFKNEKIILK